MNGIPVTVNITVDDVLLLSEILEGEDMERFKNFASRILNSVKESSKQLREAICAVNGANPFCMEKIKI